MLKTCDVMVDRRTAAGTCVYVRLNPSNHFHDKRNNCPCPPRLGMNDTKHRLPESASYHYGPVAYNATDERCTTMSGYAEL